MFDLFTGRAGKVLWLSSKEALALGNRRISSADILISLLLEGSGVAAHTLMIAGLNEQKIRREIASAPTAVPIEIITEIANDAHEQRKALGHNYVGTEHLLLALISKESGLAYQILKNLDVDLAKMRQDIIDLIVEPYKFSFHISELDIPKRFIWDLKEALGSKLPEELKTMGPDTIITVTIKKKVPFAPEAKAAPT